MVWKVVKSAQPPVRYRPNSDRRPDIVHSVQWFHNDLGRRSAAQLISGKLSPFLLGGMQRPFCSGDLRTFGLNMSASVSGD